MDSAAGSRTMHTFRKLPSKSPATIATASDMEKTVSTQPQYTQSRANPVNMLNMSSSPKDGKALDRVFTEAVAIMARLRAPGGCPWDREQTFDSIRRYTVEETYEVLDAIDRRDWAGLKDELGDLLLQVLFYAEMAREAGLFTLTEVVENLNEKLVRRHPHVFGDGVTADNPAQVLANWEEIKKSERDASGKKENVSMLDSIPNNLPALMEAAKLGSKAASIGFDWQTSAPVFEKLEEELHELQCAIENRDQAHIEEEMGDVLFTVVNLSRKLHVQAEFALRSANAKFRRRFAGMEMAAGKNQLSMLSADDLERLWGLAKQQDRADAGQ